jgi:NTP pyrophosphatase (non-canonical NTP hydrolase)
MRGARAATSKDLPMASPPASLSRLLDIMKRLRDPNGGCPWDLEQTFATIAPYTIEEAYEVAGSIEDEDWPALKDELGDLLFQVVFHARMAEEKRLFPPKPSRIGRSKLSSSASSSLPILCTRLNFRIWSARSNHAVLPRYPPILFSW